MSSRRGGGVIIKEAYWLGESNFRTFFFNKPHICTYLDNEKHILKKPKRVPMTTRITIKLYIAVDVEDR